MASIDKKVLTKLRVSVDTLSYEQSQVTPLYRGGRDLPDDFTG